MHQPSRQLALNAAVLSLAGMIALAILFLLAQSTDLPGSRPVPVPPGGPVICAHAACDLDYMGVRLSYAPRLHRSEQS
jgi:hypothetical protein